MLWCRFGSYGWFSQVEDMSVSSQWHMSPEAHCTEGDAATVWKNKTFWWKLVDFVASGFNFCSYTGTDAEVVSNINSDGAAVMLQFASETTSAATTMGSSSHSLHYTDAQHTTQRNKLLTRRQIYNKNWLLKLFFWWAAPNKSQIFTIFFLNI